MPDSPACSHGSSVRPPDWLEDRVLDDAAFEHAYESIGPEGRARFKHNLAVLHAFWGERETRRRECRDFRQGFRVEAEDTPAPYVLALCDAEYVHPDLFIAALLPAILAGCPLILPCLIPARAEPAPSLLAALELAGVEEAFSLDAGEALELFEHLRAGESRGRLLVFGRAAKADELILRAARCGTACRVIPADSSSETADFSADAGLEHIRILPDMSPEWFRNRRLRLSAL